MKNFKKVILGVIIAPLAIVGGFVSAAGISSIKKVFVESSKISEKEKIIDLSVELYEMFKKEKIESRIVDYFVDSGYVSSMNMYKIGDKWFVADRMSASSDHQNAESYFECPVKDFIERIGNLPGNPKVLRVFDPKTKRSSDIGEVCPEVVEILKEKNIYLYSKSAPGSFNFKSRNDECDSIFGWILKLFNIL